MKALGIVQNRGFLYLFPKYLKMNFARLLVLSNQDGSLTKDIDNIFYHHINARPRLRNSGT